jgi:hypothetical protein
MKTINITKAIPGILLPVMMMLISQAVWAQQPAPVAPTLPDTSKMTYNQISQQAKLFLVQAG